MDCGCYCFYFFFFEGMLIDAAREGANDYIITFDNRISEHVKADRFEKHSDGGIVFYYNDIPEFRMYYPPNLNPVVRRRKIFDVCLFDKCS